MAVTSPDSLNPRFQPRGLDAFLKGTDKLIEKISDLKKRRSIRHIIRNPLEPDHPLDQGYENLIHPGPACDYQVNGKFCYEAVFRNDERWAEDITRQARDKISGLLNESGGKIPNFNIGIFFCGIKGGKLFPKLVVSCNHVGEVRRLEKRLFGERVSLAHPWLVFEISRNFPRGEVAHLANDDTNDLEVANLGQFNSADPTSDSETHSTDDRNQHRVLHSTWNVYVLETKCKNGQITLPTDAFIGLSPESCTIATIGGLLRIEKDAAIHGLTVAHAISTDTDSTQHACSNSGEPSSHESTNNQGKSSTLKIPQIIPVGKVVRLPDRESSDLDWAIVRFEERFQVNQRELEAPLEVSEPMFFYPEHEVSCHQEVSIHRKLDVLYGWLGPYPCYIRACNDPYFVKAYPIELNDTFRMAPGDCGSWVTKVDSNDLCGHISYGSPESRFVYMIPARDIFAEIKTVDHREVFIG